MMTKSDPELRIDRTVDIAAPPERVFLALTNADEVAAWFQVRIEGTISPGAEIWMTSVHPEHAGMRWSLRIVEQTPPRRVVWQWHPGAIDPTIDYSQEPPTTVTFLLERTAQGTRLTVSETGFELLPLARRAKALEDNTQGWTDVTAWLQRYVEANA
jgi:uncharacterized protein YndB with AHSA1/START domain